MTLPIIHWYVPSYIVLLIYLTLIVISLILVILQCTIIKLDALYRPEVVQYEKHILWDTVALIMVLISPTLLIFFYDFKELILIEKFFTIICIHSTFIVPLMTWWSSHCNGGFRLFWYL